MSRTLLIYAKPPMTGVSKTRLAQSLGPAEARRIARWTMHLTMQAAMDRRWTTLLYTTPDRYLRESLGGLWPAGLRRESQGVGDLTARLDKGLAEAPAGPVLFIGADAPDLSRALIWRAFGALRQHDAVFGPASDGGFWLFGMNKICRTVSPFAPVRWSGPHAMADVRANLPSDAKVAILPTLIDLDVAADWDDWNAARRQ